LFTSTNISDYLFVIVSYHPIKIDTQDIQQISQKSRNLFQPHRLVCCTIVLRAHPVRGESHIQRNATGEVATTSPPFCNEPHRSHVLWVKAELGTTSTSWSQHHFGAIEKTERHVLKALQRGSKQ